MQAKHRAMLVGCRFYLRKLIEVLDKQPVSGVSWQTVDHLHKQIDDELKVTVPRTTAVVWHEGTQKWYKAELILALEAPMEEQEVF